MTHASLFSGIGGFDLAAAWAGWTNVFNCEIDPFCRRVLKYHFPESEHTDDVVKLAGWSNKEFVRADLMPHRIRITGIKCERLQDISEEDCMKEGILGDVEYDKYEVYGLFGNSDDGFDTPREAFASLIDKVSGRGTWKRNPWVVAYEFELVK